jgi:hypothetical protein
MFYFTFHKIWILRCSFHGYNEPVLRFTKYGYYSVLFMDTMNQSSLYLLFLICEP